MKAVVTEESQRHRGHLLETLVLVKSMDSVCEVGHSQKYSKDMTLND